jgi:hypothetical protein
MSVFLHRASPGSEHRTSPSAGLSSVRSTAGSARRRKWSSSGLPLTGGVHQFTIKVTQLSTHSACTHAACTRRRSVRGVKRPFVACATKKQVSPSAGLRTRYGQRPNLVSATEIWIPYPTTSQDAKIKKTQAMRST